MNSVVERLTAIEQEVALLLPKMAPLAERIAALDQKVTGFARQLTDLAAESATFKQDIEFTRKSLAHIQTLLGESRSEIEQFAASQDENQQRYKAMESFVGTLYQLHSQSVQISQWLGLADQAQAVFPAPPSVPIELSAPVVSIPVKSVPPLAEVPVPEPPADEPDLPIPEAVTDTTPEEPMVAEAVPPVPSEPDWNTTIPDPADDSDLPISESELDALLSDVPEKEPEPWAAPSLPEITPLHEIGSVHSEVDMDAEHSDEMASHLDVPPLNLSVPALPEQNEPATMTAEDDQEIEAMLAAMGTPVTVGS